MSPLVKNYLTTRKTLQRLARFFGLPEEKDTHELALSIEEYLRLLFVAARMLRNGVRGIKCEECGDNDGPFGLMGESFLCEPCIERLQNEAICPPKKVAQS